MLLPQEKRELEQVNHFRKTYQVLNPKIVYYMPTFRESETKFFETVDLERFQQYLKKEQILFCIKLHPFSKLKEAFSLAVKEDFSNILLIETDSDPYVLLKRTDVLVTDYSSIFFDYLLLDRPIVFFAYDKEEYMTCSRELYYKYEEMTPGQKAETMEELISALHMACYPSEEYQSFYAVDRKRVREKMFGTPKELTSSKLMEQIRKLVN